MRNRLLLSSGLLILALGANTLAATLSVKGVALELDGKPFDMWGVRTASASQTQELTDRLIARLDDYLAHGVNSVSVFYMGSSAAYTDPFVADGTAVDAGHQQRIERIVQACDRRGMVVIVGIFYQRCQQPNLRDWSAATEAVRTVARLLKPHRNVILNIANEQNSGRYKSLPWSRVQDVEDLAELCRVVKTVDPDRIVGAGGYDHASNGRLGRSKDVDVLLFDTAGQTRSGPVYERYLAAGVRDKPMVNVETFGAWTNQFLPPGVFPEAVRQAYHHEIDDAARYSGLYVHLHNTPWFQAFTPEDEIRYDLGGHGTADHPGVRWYFEGVKKARERLAYFPPPDAEGGWRRATSPDDARRLAGLDTAKLDAAFDAAQASTKNGGLLVVRHGYLAYERYFGLGHRDATPNLASCAKSVTSVAVGILMAERPELFPDGLDQRVFTPAYMPPDVFPLSDPAKSGIKLGQLLAFTAGIRGNNPSRVHGREVQLDPPGPDGTAAMIDAVAAGRRDIVYQGRPTSAATLWCRPGEGYSYASASAHLASMMVRHVSGMELEDYIRDRLARPLAWGEFTYGYRFEKQITHTPGGGAIAVRATDMLRFGYLLLREGRWGQRQVVPAEYVRHCGTASRYNPHSPYSLQFDVNVDGHLSGVPRDAFWKGGSGAHMLYIVPSLDLVVWKLAGRDGQYQERDTGVPLDPAIVQAAQSRSDWKATLDEREGQRDVLRRVVAAVVEFPSR